MCVISPSTLTAFLQASPRTGAALRVKSGLSFLSQRGWDQSGGDTSFTSRGRRGLAPEPTRSVLLKPEGCLGSQKRPHRPAGLSKCCPWSGLYRPWSLVAGPTLTFSRHSRRQSSLELRRAQERSAKDSKPPLRNTDSMGGCDGRISSNTHV